MSVEFFCCHFNLKREEARLLSSLFKLKQQQKAWADIWSLVFGF